MGDATVFLVPARQALSAGDPGRALPLLKEAVTAEPGSCQARMLLGICLWFTGSREDAVDEARRAVELDGQSAEAHYNLGAMLQMTGQLENAAQHLEVAVSLKPDHQKAADALRSVRLALPPDPPPEEVPLLPPHAESAREEEPEPPTQLAVPPSAPVEPVQAAPEQAGADMPEPDRQVTESDWFDTLAAALQTIDPPEDAESERWTEQGADGGPGPAGPIG